MTAAALYRRPAYDVCGECYSAGDHLRLKAPGTFWTAAIGECFLFLRSQALSGRWEVVLDNLTRQTAKMHPFLWMWPNARISVMGGEVAAAVLAMVKRESLQTLLFSFSAVLYRYHRQDAYTACLNNWGDSAPVRGKSVTKVF